MIRYGKYICFMTLFIMGLGPVDFVHTGEFNSLPAKQSAIVESELNLLVQQYLLSADTGQSKSLLKEILGHKAMTVSSIETSLKEGRLYPPEPSTGSLHKSIQVAGYKMSYALYVPKDYDPKVAYPLVVCLHGAGFVGDSYIDRWQTRLGKDAILVCPTIGMGAWWSQEGEMLVMDTIDAISSQYHIDPDKVFLTGMSNGGIGVYLIGMFHADRLAAISPMASGIPEEVFPFLKNFSLTGIYIIHGAHDQVMPVRLSQEVSEYLKKEDILFTYREHGKEHPRAGGHFFPREELPALVNWFKAQGRIADPARVISVADRNHHAPYYWTEINQIKGKVADVQKSILSNEEVELVKSGAYASLSAELEGNEIRVTTERVRQFTLFFNQRLIDFSKSIHVVTNGEKKFEGRLVESPEFLLKEAKRRGDGISFYTASVTIDLDEIPTLKQ